MKNAVVGNLPAPVNLDRLRQVRLLFLGAKIQPNFSFIDIILSL